MFDYKRKESVAAALYCEGCKVIALPSQTGQPDYLFVVPSYCGCPALATSDIDFRIRMEQLPRLLASLIEKYCEAE